MKSWRFDDLKKYLIRCGGSLVAHQTSGADSGFESGISHNDPDALQDHCVIMLVSG